MMAPVFPSEKPIYLAKTRFQAMHTISIGIRNKMPCYLLQRNTGRLNGGIVIWALAMICVLLNAAPSVHPEESSDAASQNKTAA